MNENSSGSYPSYRDRSPTKLEWTICSQIDPIAGEIAMHLQTFEAQVTAWVVRTKEQLVREGLKKLGWLSPEEATILRDAIQHCDAVLAADVLQNHWLRDELRAKLGEAHNKVFLSKH